MRHARPDDLDRIEALLVTLRAIEPLRERSSGTFYVRSKPFLHFHEHDGDIICDVRLDPSAADFERRVVTTKSAQATLVRDVKRAVEA